MNSIQTEIPRYLYKGTILFWNPSHKTSFGFISSETLSQVVQKAFGWSTRAAQVI